VRTSAGVVDVLGWGVAQAGSWGMQSHRSGAWMAEAGFQPAGMPRLKPWLRAGYYRASGDKDATDGRHGTYFQMLPTPRPYARIPFFNGMNNEDLSATLILRPHARWTVRSEVHGLRLASGSDLWYAGGGAFQPWTFGYQGKATGGRRGLATLYDVSVEHALNPHVTLTGYAGYAVGHSAVRAVYPRNPNGSMAYLEFGDNRGMIENPVVREVLAEVTARHEARTLTYEFWAECYRTVSRAGFPELVLNYGTPEWASSLTRQLRAESRPVMSDPPGPPEAS
jgi:hypothetical protein